MVTTLANQWVLITGASAGFGAATAKAFGAQKCNLLLGARRKDRLSDVAKEAIHAGAPKALYHALDVESTQSVSDFFVWVKQQTNRLDVLINNAGGAHGKDDLVDGKDEDWEAMIESNLLGLCRVTRAALPMMKNNPGSSILNIGSIAGRVAYEGGSVYCAAKAGELQVTRALRLELNGTGIRVSTIDPGFAKTEFSQVRFKGDQEKAEAVYKGMHPLVAGDIAETLVWVASRPSHVCIDELVIKPTDQAAIHKVYRRE